MPSSLTLFVIWQIVSFWKSPEAADKSCAINWHDLSFLKSCEASEKSCANTCTSTSTNLQCQCHYITEAKFSTSTISVFVFVFVISSGASLITSSLNNSQSPHPLLLSFIFLSAGDRALNHPTASIREQVWINMTLVYLWIFEQTTAWPNMWRSIG